MSSARPPLGAAAAVNSHIPIRQGKQVGKAAGYVARE
jgi:hypothetical protein